jgi:outer membrane autotransporter protein
MIGGTADLTGGTVEVAAIDPRISYVDGHTYATPILSATGGRGGTEFAGAGTTSDSAFLTPTLSYVGNDVFLTIAVTQDFATAAETVNQAQAATALNDLEQSGDALAAFNTIANMNDDDARGAFDLTSGEVHAAGQQVIDQTFALFNRTLRSQGVAGIGLGNVGAPVFTAPLGYGPAVAAGNAGVIAIDDAAAYAEARMGGAWAAPLGGFGRIDGDGNAARLDYWNAGLAGGYEGVIDVASGTAVGGFGFGYIHSRGTIDDRLSTFDADGFYLGAYGAWADGPWNVAGSLSYGGNGVSTQRNIAFMGTTAEASYWTHTIGLSGEAAYAVDLADTTRLAPLFTLDASWSGHGGFTETGAGAFNLTSGSENWSRLDVGLGLALTHAILTDSGKVTLEGRAVWEHAFSDVVPSQALALAGSPTGFTVLGPDAGRDRLRVGAGLSWDVSDDVTVRARYDGLFSGNQANHSASVGLNVRF